MIRLRFAIVLLAAACATPARTVPPDLDAANPEAEETPAGAPLTPLTAPGAQPSGAAAPTKNPGVREPVSNHKHFACPMHPEVTADSPGRCPKCGMDLVPVTEGAK